MTVAYLKQEITAYSKRIGIDKIGFASAEPFLTLKERLIKHRQLGYESGFEEKNLDKRTNPKLLMPEAKTIIAIALAYPSKMNDKEKRKEYRGIFCRASWGRDYHDVLREKMEQLAAFITEKAPATKIISMVDTGELSDRAVAERAGIGWSGKNCAIISPEFGSYMYLGELITSLSLPPDNPIEDQCGTCNKCVEACPTGALVQGGQLNAQKCIAYLTQTKEFIPLKYRKKIGNRLYGCDTCQQVCPKNKGKDFHLHDEFEADPEIAKPSLMPLLTLSNRQFKNKFGHVSGAWRGKKPIQRNAIIALAHYKEKAALPLLFELLHKDTRPAIRGMAAWAIGEIDIEAGQKQLERAKERENDRAVLLEINNSLKNLPE